MRFTVCGYRAILVLYHLVLPTVALFHISHRSRLHHVYTGLLDSPTTTAHFTFHTMDVPHRFGFVHRFTVIYTRLHPHMLPRTCPTGLRFTDIHRLPRVDAFTRYGLVDHTCYIRFLHFRFHLHTHRFTRVGSLHVCHTVRSHLTPHGWFSRLHTVYTHDWLRFFRLVAGFGFAGYGYSRTGYWFYTLFSSALYCHRLVRTFYALHTFLTHCGFAWTTTRCRPRYVGLLWIPQLPSHCHTALVCHQLPVHIGSPHVHHSFTTWFTGFTWLHTSYTTCLVTPRSHTINHILYTVQLPPPHLHWVVHCHTAHALCYAIARTVAGTLVGFHCTLPGLFTLG